MKITIIGASISGLFTAYLWPRKVLMSKLTRGGLLAGARTLIVTNKINEILNFVPEEAIINRIRYIELFSRSRSARLKLSSPDLIVERERLLNLLARLAKRAGAKIMFNHQFEGFAHFGRKILVSLRNLEAGEEHRRSMTF
jgi:flavin-dependent dehydrogenase